MIQWTVHWPGNKCRRIFKEEKKNKREKYYLEVKKDIRISRKCKEIHIVRVNSSVLCVFFFIVKDETKLQSSELA